MLENVRHFCLLLLLILVLVLVLIVVGTDLRFGGTRSCHGLFFLAVCRRLRDQKKANGLHVEEPNIEPPSHMLAVGLGQWPWPARPRPVAWPIAPWA